MRQVIPRKGDKNCIVFAASNNVHRCPHEESTEERESGLRHLH